MIGEAAMRPLAARQLRQTPRKYSPANVDELLDTLMQDAVQSTGRQLAMLTKEDKVAVVRYLDEKGAFLIKKSAEKVADFLGISRFTVYNYLNEGNGTKESGEDG